MGQLHYHSWAIYPNWESPTWIRAVRRYPTERDARRHLGPRAKYPNRILPCILSTCTTEFITEDK